MVRVTTPKENLQHQRGHFPLSLKKVKAIKQEENDGKVAKKLNDAKYL